MIDFGEQGAQALLHLGLGGEQAALLPQDLEDEAAHHLAAEHRDPAHALGQPRHQLDHRALARAWPLQPASSPQAATQLLKQSCVVVLLEQEMQVGELGAASVRVPLREPAQLELHAVTLALVRLGRGDQPGRAQIARRHRDRRASARASSPRPRDRTRGARAASPPGRAPRRAGPGGVRRRPGAPGAREPPGCGTDQAAGGQTCAACSWVSSGRAAPRVARRQRRRSP